MWRRILTVTSKLHRRPALEVPLPPFVANLATNKRVCSLYRAKIHDTDHRITPTARYSTDKNRVLTTQQIETLRIAETI